MDQSKYAYTRAYHFERWLNIFQAKERQRVPIEIIELVKTKLAGKEITVYSIRRLLRDLGHLRWIDHARQIDAIIRNVSLPTLSAEEANKAKKMFDQYGVLGTFENTVQVIASQVISERNQPDAEDACSDT